MKNLYVCILVAFFIAKSNSLYLNKCIDGELPNSIRIIGCENETSTCVIYGFSRPLIEYQVNFITPKFLKNVSLEATIDIENVILPKVLNWKESPTIVSSFPLEMNQSVTLSSKIHYIGDDWWFPKTKEHSLNAKATIKVNGKDDELIYCAKVPLQFTFCVKDCQKMLEELKNVKNPLNLTDYEATTEILEPSKKEESVKNIPTFATTFEELVENNIDSLKSDRVLKYEETSNGLVPDGAETNPKVLTHYVPPFEDLVHNNIDLTKSHDSSYYPDNTTVASFVHKEEPNIEILTKYVPPFEDLVEGNMDSKKPLDGLKSE